MGGHQPFYGPLRPGFFFQNHGGSLARISQILNKKICKILMFVVIVAADTRADAAVAIHSFIGTAV